MSVVVRLGMKSTRTLLLALVLAVAPATFVPETALAQVDAAVECVPQKLRPLVGAAARIKLTGTNDPVVVSTYRSGVIALFCEPLDTPTGWSLLGQAALAGYRPAIRLISAQVPEEPSVLSGQEAEFFPVILKEAKAGASSANNAAAYMKLNSLGTEYDPAGAAELFARSARTGNQRAIENLAYMRAVGLGTEKSSRSALGLAASLPAQRATRAVARIIVGLAGGDPAAGGEAQAPDTPAIDAWVEKFSRLKDLGPRLRMEFEEALEAGAGKLNERALVEQAARFGVGEAMVRQATALLASGQIGDANDAIALLQKAALEGDVDAPRILGRIAAEYLSDSDLPRSATAALRMAADAGNTKAMISYADLLYFPNYGTPSINLGAQMLQRAAEAGSAEAQQRYAVLKLMGIGVEADPEAALTWMRASADGGYPLAKVMLAQIGERLNFELNPAPAILPANVPLTPEVMDEASDIPVEQQ